MCRGRQERLTFSKCMREAKFVTVHQAPPSQPVELQQQSAALQSTLQAFASMLDTEDVFSVPQGLGEYSFFVVDRDVMHTQC